jgi:hypothetical protein
MVANLVVQFAYLILDFPKSRIKKARDMKLEPMSDLEI